MDGGRISKLFLSFISLAAAAFAWCCCVAVVPLYSFNEILCFKKSKEKMGFFGRQAIVVWSENISEV